MGFPAAAEKMAVPSSGYTTSRSTFFLLFFLSASGTCSGRVSVTSGIFGMILLLG